jgi:hypothetical protein
MRGEREPLRADGTPVRRTRSSASRGAGAGARRGGSPGRATLLIVGGVVAVGVVIALIVSSLGGSSPSHPASATRAAKHPVSKRPASHHHASTGTVVNGVNPAEVNVAVLNATETTGLAHRTATQLQEHGFSQASAQSGRPAGASQVTVVQYSAGQKPGAEAVAQSLGVSTVEPVEEAVAALAGSAKVVVVVGADKAAASP